MRQNYTSSSNGWCKESDNIARRGELNFALPSGYVRHPSGEVTFDPDEQVQQVIRLIFDKFEELGTLNAVLRYLVKYDIHLGIRARTRLNKGELEWRRPNRMTLQTLLKHPIYALCLCLRSSSSGPASTATRTSAHGSGRDRPR